MKRLVRIASVLMLMALLGAPMLGGKALADKVAVPPRASGSTVQQNISLATATSGSFIGGFHNISTITSTVPTNGDVNPYGTAVVPHTIGALIKGNVLVSNFNNSANLQGTGTTIVQLAPNGTTSLFAQIDAHHLPGPCPGGLGLTTALVVLSSGWVIVGSLPTTDGASATAKAGCLLVLNSSGHVVETFSGAPLNGPWDMVARDSGGGATLFVTNVLNDTLRKSPHRANEGTVVRIDLEIAGERMPEAESMTVIGSSFGQRADPDALVIGPTGVALGANGTLYVADTLNNRIASIPNALYRRTSAGTGHTVSQNGALNNPLGLTIAPNGDILTVNGGDGNIVEITPHGSQIATRQLDATGAGTLFGLALVSSGSGVYFVDDGTNTLNLLH